MYVCFFFFSSRRRHTRCGRDWSSDVCSSDLDNGVERPAREVRDLDGRHGWCGVGEEPRPPDVVEVVSCTFVARAEPGERAIDGGHGCTTRPDSETLRYTGAKALEYHVGPPGQRRPELGVMLEIPHDRFLARVERRFPSWSRGSQRIAVRRFYAHDACPEPQQLAACERARQVTREIDDQQAVQHHDRRR